MFCDVVMFLCFKTKSIASLMIIIQFCVLCRYDVQFAFQDNVYISPYISIRQFCVLCGSDVYLHFQTKSVALHWRSSEVVCSLSWWCLVCFWRQSLSPYAITRQSVSWPGQLHYMYLTPASNSVFTAQFSTWDVPCDIHQSQVYQRAATRPSDESRSCYHQTTFGSSVPVISHR